MYKLRKIEKEIIDTIGQILICKSVNVSIPIIHTSKFAGDGIFVEKISSQDKHIEVLECQLKELENKRRFLLDSRESWLPKTLWNLFIPIVVSVVVTVLTLYLTKLSE